MILKPFMGNLEIRIATSSRIGCEIEFYVCIIGITSTISAGALEHTLH